MWRNPNMHSPCVCLYVRMYVRTYVRTYVCMYVRTYVRMYVCTYVRMYVCIFIYIGVLCDGLINMYNKLWIGNLMFKVMNCQRHYLCKESISNYGE